MANLRRPSQKRRKLSLAQTTHVRNGGGADSFLPVDAAPWVGDDEGSDTEEEDNEEMAQFFLNKMTDDTNKKVETVFGEGFKVWKSIGGTVYADLEDKLKKQQRAEQLWGAKRKRGDEETKTKTKKDEGKVKYPTLPQIPPISAYPPPPTEAYRQRTPNDTMFNRGSAGIDPLGAHNRPIKPLPPRQQATEGLQTLPNRIVSGSFGSFEVRQPSRFDERPYRLMPHTRAEDDGRREGGNSLDPFKGKPWLRR